MIGTTDNIDRLNMMITQMRADVKREMAEQEAAIIAMNSTKESILEQIGWHEDIIKQLKERLENDF
jgi:putative N-acetylmannosamine-6-phosphate epimerase